MDEPDYWKRLARRRLTRRHLLTGAAGMGACLAAASVVGCGGGEEKAPAGTPIVTAGPQGADSFAALPAMGPRGPWQPAGARGGTARWFGFDALPLDTYPPNLWIDSAHPTFQGRQA